MHKTLFLQTITCPDFVIVVVPTYCSVLFLLFFSLQMKRMSKISELDKIQSFTNDHIFIPFKLFWYRYFTLKTFPASISDCIFSLVVEHTMNTNYCLSLFCLSVNNVNESPIDYVDETILRFPHIPQWVITHQSEIVWHFLFHPALNRYAEDDANVSHVVYLDDSYRTSFHFVYRPQAKILGEFSVTKPI